MKLNTILASVLVGALATTSVVVADGWRHHDRDHSDEDRTVIGTKRLSDRRGEVSFKVKEGMRRDSLELKTDARRLSVIAVELEYSDGRVMRHEGLQVWQGERGDAQFTIQHGRPPGLRVVRVEYRMSRDQSAKLQLIQVGDGYTRDQDLWKNLKHDYDLGSDGKYYLDDDRR